MLDRFLQEALSTLLDTCARRFDDQVGVSSSRAARPRPHALSRQGLPPSFEQRQRLRPVNRQCALRKAAAAYSPSTQCHEFGPAFLALQAWLQHRPFETAPLPRRVARARPHAAWKLASTGKRMSRQWRDFHITEPEAVTEIVTTGTSTQTFHTNTMLLC